MPHPYTLRPIRNGDAEILYEIYAGTRAEEMAQVSWSEPEKQAFLRMQFDAQRKHYADVFPEADFQLILSGERPIGRLYVSRGASEIRIIDIALLPDHRNAGVGTSLLKDLMAEADAAGTPLRIHVERTNPALRLYARLGFSEIGSTGIYLLMERPAGDRER